MQGEGRTGRADPGHFLVDDRAMQEVTAGTAIFLGYRAAEQALFARLAPEIAVDDAVLLPLRVIGDHLFFNEAAGGLAKHLVLFGKQGSWQHVRSPSARLGVLGSDHAGGGTMAHDPVIVFSISKGGASRKAWSA